MKLVDSNLNSISRKNSQLAKIKLGDHTKTLWYNLINISLGINFISVDN